MFDPAEAVRQLEAVGDDASPDACRDSLAEAKRLKSWVDRRAAHVTRVLAAATAHDPGVDPADDIAKNTGCSTREARKKATTADQLGHLPETDRALGDGDITGDHADAIADLRSRSDADRREALARNEVELIRRGRDLTADQFRRLLRNWEHAHADDDGIADHDRQRAKRRLSLVKADDGMGLIRGALDPEAFELASRVIGDIANELFHGTGHGHSPTEMRNNPQIMADAFVEACRRAAGASAADGRKPRATVVVTISEERLLGRLDHAGVPVTLSDGTTIPAETARRLACDADLVPMVLGGQGRPLDVGRARRLATNAQRLALRAMHDSCAVEWCDRPFGWCDIHHLRPWESGGGTDLANLVPLCSKHHHLVHEGGWATEAQPNGSHRFRHRDPDRQPRPEHSGPCHPTQEFHAHEARLAFV